MTSESVLITANARRILKELAVSTGSSQAVILEQALEAYRRRIFLNGLASDFQALRSNPNARQEELAERAELDTTLKDGQDD